MNLVNCDVDILKVNEANFLRDIDRKLIKMADYGGYVAVSVGFTTEKVKLSKIFRRLNITAEPGPNENDGLDDLRYPFIWKIIDILLKGIPGSAGCGNGHQRQLTALHPFRDNVIYYKENNEWFVEGLKNLENDFNEALKLSYSCGNVQCKNENAIHAYSESKFKVYFKDKNLFIRNNNGADDLILKLNQEFIRGWNDFYSSTKGTSIRYGI